MYGLETFGGAEAERSPFLEGEGMAEGGGAAVAAYVV
jgi:hypothetical protein